MGLGLCQSLRQLSRAWDNHARINRGTADHRIVGSTSLKRSCKKPIANQSATFRQWCSLMVYGSAYKPNKKALKRIAVDVSGTRNAANGSSCSSLRACGTMAAGNDQSWTLKSLTRSNKPLEKGSCSACGNAGSRWKRGCKRLCVMAARGWKRH